VFQTTISATVLEDKSKPGLPYDLRANPAGKKKSEKRKEEPASTGLGGNFKNRTGSPQKGLAKAGGNPRGRGRGPTEDKKGGGQGDQIKGSALLSSLKEAAPSGRKSCKQGVEPAAISDGGGPPITSAKRKNENQRKEKGRVGYLSSGGKDFSFGGGKPVR